MTDYRNYKFSLQEMATALIKGGGIVGITAFLFYNHIVAVLLGIPFMIVYVNYEKERKKEIQKQQMVMEFKEMMQSIAGGLAAGYALENTFLAAREDLHKLYPEGRSILAEECTYIIRNLEVNRSVEELLEELGTRTEIKEIQDFAKIIAIAKRSGGNMIGIIRNATKQINASLEVKNDIAIMVASKKLEQRIMMLMPFAIVGYLRLSNPGYLDVLYGNVLGICLMTICLVVIIVAGFIGKKILAIV